MVALPVHGGYWIDGATVGDICLHQATVSHLDQANFPTSNGGVSSTSEDKSPSCDNNNNNNSCKRWNIFETFIFYNMSKSLFVNYKNVIFRHKYLLIKHTLYGFWAFSFLCSNFRKFYSRFKLEFDETARCYRKHFLDREHFNFYALDPQLGPIVLSVRSETISSQDVYRIVLRSFNTVKLCKIQNSDQKSAKNKCLTLFLA